MYYLLLTLIGISAWFVFFFSRGHSRVIGARSVATDLIVAMIVHVRRATANKVQAVRWAVYS